MLPARIAGTSEPAIDAMIATITMIAASLGLMLVGDGVKDVDLGLPDLDAHQVAQFAGGAC